MSVTNAYQSGMLTEHVGGVARLQFTSEVPDRQPKVYGIGAVGDVTGQVSVGGEQVGRVGVYPSEDDPESTDYIRFDLTGWDPGTYDVAVDGTEVGTLDVAPADEQEQSDTLPGGTTTPAAEDDRPEPAGNTGPGLSSSSGDDMLGVGLGVLAAIAAIAYGVIR